MLLTVLGSRGSTPRESGTKMVVSADSTFGTIGGGQLERWKEGAIVRLAPEIEWPTDEWVELRIVRTNAREGQFELYLDPHPDDSEPGLRLLKEDEFVSGFKGFTATKADLWLGGFSTQAQQWLVQVKDIVVIRRKK